VYFLKMSRFNTFTKRHPKVLIQVVQNMVRRPRKFMPRFCRVRVVPFLLLNLSLNFISHVTRHKPTGEGFNRNNRNRKRKG
jgi:hypothetical protein